MQKETFDGGGRATDLQKYVKADFKPPVYEFGFYGQNVRHCHCMLSHIDLHLRWICFVLPSQIFQKLIHLAKSVTKLCL